MNSIEHSPPRLRLRSKIDFTKAKKNCSRCFGTGINGYKTVEDHEGTTCRAPIVCQCVSRNGGVEADKLDQIMLECQRSLADGSFGEKMASDILNMPEESRVNARRNVVAQIENPDTNSMVKDAMQRCLDLVDGKGAN